MKEESVHLAVGVGGEEIDCWDAKPRVNIVEDGGMEVPLSVVHRGLAEKICLPVCCPRNVRGPDGPQVLLCPKAQDLCFLHKTLGVGAPQAVHMRLCVHIVHSDQNVDVLHRV